MTLRNLSNSETPLMLSNGESAQLNDAWQDSYGDHNYPYIYPLPMLLQLTTTATKRHHNRCFGLDWLALCRRCQDNSVRWAIDKTRLQTTEHVGVRITVDVPSPSSLTCYPTWFKIPNTHTAYKTTSQPPHNFVEVIFWFRIHLLSYLH